jgi:beta-N-acetylhexosaminidase
MTAETARRLLAAVVMVAALTTGVPAAGARSVLPERLPTPHELAAAAYQRMSPAERVGQLFMAGVPSSGVSDKTLKSLAARAVGNVILDRNTTDSATQVGHESRRIVARLRVAGVAPFVSTDQEGGAVQRLTGDGFTSIPAALQQGRMSTGVLRAASAGWGRQLARAGVDLDLAPVADTVPAGHAHANQPIGRYDREYGHRPAVVASHVDAFIRGMRDAGVTTTLKHFPGLGRASGNTDVERHVTDPTGRHDPYLRPFRDGVRTGAPFVMVSSATYPHIDASRPACFSRTVMTSLLRRDLNFAGAIVSDDLGTAALAHVPLGRRAVRFFRAGGTMVLDTTAGQLPTMIRAVRHTARSSRQFARTVKAAVMANLTVKAAAGLLTAPG